MRHGLPAFLALAVWTAPALAQSQRPFDVAPTASPPRATPASVRLEYVVGVGADICPNERGVRTALAAKLGYDPVTSSRETLTVRVARRGAGFSGTAEIRDSGGRSVWSRPPLSDGDCQRLVDVLALAIAIELDPGAAGGASTPAPSDPVPEQPPTPPAREVPAPGGSPPKSARPEFRIGVRGGASVGALPGAAGVVVADVGVGWPFFSLNLEGRADMPSTSTVGGGVQLRTSALSVALVPCGHWRWLLGCAVVAVGALRLDGVQGPNLSNPATSTGSYGQAGLRAGVEWPLPFARWMSVRATADALITFLPRNAQVTTQAGARTTEVVWATAPFSGLFAGGVVLRF